MKQKKVFVTRAIPLGGIKLLRGAGYNVSVSPHNRVLTKREVITGAKGADALLCLLTDKLDKSLIESLGEDLKIIANYAVGYDNIDVITARERDIVVTNTPGVLTESVAEHTFTLMLSIGRRIVEADQFVRDGKFKGWEPMLLLGSDFKEKELGIVGLGRIGESLVEKAFYGLKMKINYFDIKRNKKFERKFKAKYMKLDDLLKSSDFVSLHVPLLDSTKHLISTKQLKMMKKTACLINTSRGPVVDEKALSLALETGEIRGAALDVFEFEPRVVARLKKLDSIILTPHIASASEETREKMSEIAAQNIIAVLSGKKALNLVK